MGVGRSKLSGEDYWLVLVPAAFVDVALVSAGGEDISSDWPQPTMKTETTAIKNNNFFIVFLTSRWTCQLRQRSGATLWRNRRAHQSFIALKGL